MRLESDSSFDFCSRGNVLAMESLRLMAGPGSCFGMR
jgi:hypothetical protein